MTAMTSAFNDYRRRRGPGLWAGMTMGILCVSALVAFPARRMHS
jgi:hypothetical protein